jgi:hypothetical protein
MLFEVATMKIWSEIVVHVNVTRVGRSLLKIIWSDRSDIIVYVNVTPNDENME